MEAEKEVHRIPQIGEKAPPFRAKTTHGIINFPDDYRGKWVVLFSHPADFTPVCTTEFYAFQKRYEEFKKLNTELIGLSIDQVFSHIKWGGVDQGGARDGDKNFPVITDDLGNIAKLYGMVRPRKGTRRFS